MTVPTPPTSTTWHATSIEQALTTLESSADRGLSADVVRARTIEFGENVLQHARGRGVVRMLLAQFAGERLKEMNLGHALAIGLILSLGAVVGDLIESAFKREAGAKDSGRLFPGIGGILDLIDSPLFNAPLLYLYLRHVLTH